MKLCPFCGHDLTSVHDEVLQRGIDFSAMCASLCSGCGEPIIITPDGHRKPTDDEYMTLNSDRRLATARGAWLTMKHRDRPPISELWARYKDSKLSDMTLDNIENDNNLMVTAQDIFLSGVTLAMHMFEKAINDADSPEDFSATMMLIEAELNAYQEMREDDRYDQ